MKLSAQESLHYSGLSQTVGRGRQHEFQPRSMSASGVLMLPSALCPRDRLCCWLESERRPGHKPTNAVQ